MLLVSSLLVQMPAAFATGTEVLILGSTVTGGINSIEANEVSAKGLTPVVIDDATWRGMNQAEFSAYRAVVLGDASCSGTAPAAAEATAGMWGPAITGNVLIAGTDPVVHAAQGGDALTRRAIDFVVDQAGKTGAYIALSCYYASSAAKTPVHVLDALRPGGFTVSGANCYNSVHIVATHPALEGLTDSQLSNWGCSVHEAFDTWPGDFTVLAIAKDFGAAYTASDGSIGTPYILARGSGLRSFPLSVDPMSQTRTVNTTATVTAQLLDASTGAPVPGIKLSARVSSGPNLGTSVTCSTCTTDVAGHVAFAYVGPDYNGIGTDTLQVWIDNDANGIPSAGEPQTTAIVIWQPLTGADTYVALGDSFSSGEGAGSYISGSDDPWFNECHRSTKAYSYIAKSFTGMPPKYEFHACSGALVEDFFSPYPSNHPNNLAGSSPTETHAQLDWLNPASKVVTLTIGGNNAHFPEVIGYCAVRFNRQLCKDFYGDSVDNSIINLSKSSGGRIEDNLPDLYTAIRAKAPAAKVIVLGYPRLFPTDRKSMCNIAVGKAFRPEDMNWINGELTKLNTAISDAAQKAGFDYVNVTDAFKGHELCTKSPYVNGVVLLDPQQSFHPNKDGQKQLAALLQPHLH